MENSIVLKRNANLCLQNSQLLELIAEARAKIEQLKKQNQQQFYPHSFYHIVNQSFYKEWYPSFKQYLDFYVKSFEHKVPGGFVTSDEDNDVQFYEFEVCEGNTFAGILDLYFVSKKYQVYEMPLIDDNDQNMGNRKFINDHIQIELSDLLSLQSDGQIRVDTVVAVD